MQGYFEFILVYIKIIKIIKRLMNQLIKIAKKFNK